MSKVTHTHELIVHNFDTEATPVSWTELVKQGSYEECEEALVKRADEINVTTGYLLSGGGYEIVSLIDREMDALKESAPEMFEVLKMIEGCINDNIPLEKDDPCHRRIKAVLEKAKVKGNYKCSKCEQFLIDGWKCPSADCENRLQFG